jgi:hypothetical protein
VTHDERIRYYQKADAYRSPTGRPSALVSAAAGPRYTETIGPAFFMNLQCPSVLLAPHFR